MTIKRILPTFLLLVCVALTFIVYSPGLSGYFLFDDTINIVENTSLRVTSFTWESLKQAAFSGDAGRLGRPISMLSFALDYYYSGLSPYDFKLTNVVIHLLNGVCIFVLTGLLLDAHRRHSASAIGDVEARWISIAVAAAWLLHPLNLSGVLYIVQRMTSLATLFTLLGLISYVRGRMLDGYDRSGWIWIIASFAVFIPLAALSKENGALLPIFMLVTEFFFFRFETRLAGTKRLLALLFCATTLVPALAVGAYSIYNPGWILSAYSIRDFTLTERLMTEARVLWLYIRLAFTPDITALGMYHDDIQISKSLLEPVSTLIAVLGIAVLTAFAFLARRRHPIAAFGILFFLVGHSMESSIFALEIAHEHRNYLPMFGLLLPLAYYLLFPLRHRQSLSARRFAAVLFISLLAGVTYLRSTHWSDAVTMKEKEVEHHPDSVRANIDIGSFYAAMPASSQIEADEFYNNAYAYYAKASSISPSDTLGLFGLIALNAKYSLPIEESWSMVLARRIEKYPFAPSTANSLLNLQKCVISGNCSQAEGTLQGLFEAALNNPTLNGKAKSQVLFAWSDYLFKIKKQKEAAIKAAFQASEVHPSDLNAQITLIRFLISMEKPLDAHAHINRVRQLDTIRLHTSELNDLESLIVKNADKKIEG